MLAKLAAVTLGDVWWLLLRGTGWALCLYILANVLGLEWSWSLVVFAVGADLIDFLIYRHDWRS